MQLLSVYRKLDPEKDSEEEEYVENLFDCLTCLVDEDAGKEKFVKGEGVELMLIMLREATKFGKARALRVLDHALAGNRQLSGQPPTTGQPTGDDNGASVACCERLVDSAGLRTIFGMFMKARKHHQTLDEQENMEHLLGIFASLLHLLPHGVGEARIRVLAKFIENDYGKIEKLVALRREYANKLEGVEREIDLEKKKRKSGEVEDDMEVEGYWLSRRLDGGLFVLQVFIYHLPFFSTFVCTDKYAPTVDRRNLGVARRRR